MKKLVAILFFFPLLTIWSGAAWAHGGGSHPPPPPPSHSPCDDEDGWAAFLCNKFCDELECDVPDNDTSHVPRRHYGRSCHHNHNNNGVCNFVDQIFRCVTGRHISCEDNRPPDTTCPCVTAFPLFAQLVNTMSAIQQCIADPTVVNVITPSGMFALVNNGVQPPYCSVGNVPPFLNLTAAEVTVCRNALLQAAASRGVPCNPPE